jgi:hypothetical protein
MQSACTVLYYRSVWLHVIFPHYFINGTIFRKKLLNVKCVFWYFLQILTKTFLTLRRVQRYIITIVKKPSLKYSLFLSYFTETWIFSTNFRIKAQISNFNQWEMSFSMQTDWRTDKRTERHDDAKSGFSQFYKGSWNLCGTSTISCTFVLNRK